MKIGLLVVAALRKANRLKMWKQGGSRSSALDRAMAQLAAKKVGSAGDSQINVSSRRCVCVVIKCMNLDIVHI